MMPLSLFPIPGPFPSPTVERIIVELEGVAAPGVGGWTTAAIAGIVAVVVALLTHGFTRARDHANWVRERIFEATTSWAEAEYAFRNALLASPQIRPTNSSHEAANMESHQHNRDSLKEAYTPYMRALINLQILTAEDSTSRDVKNIIQLDRELYDRALKSFSDSDPGLEFSSDAYVPLMNVFDQHDLIFEILLEDIQTSYLSFKSRRRQTALEDWWDEYRYRRLVRRRSNQESRLSSVAALEELREKLSKGS